MKLLSRKASNRRQRGSARQEQSSPQQAIPVTCAQGSSLACSAASTGLRTMQIGGSCSILPSASSARWPAPTLLRFAFMPSFMHHPRRPGNPRHSYLTAVMCWQLLQWWRPDLRILHPIEVMTRGAAPSFRLELSNLCEESSVSGTAVLGQTGWRLFSFVAFAHHLGCSSSHARLADA